ncbi:MAG: hypothetical protein HQK49_00435 [Oligoflexia bacterium]|nr:hypothetical protein [Oligoflexia bacterium]
MKFLIIGLSLILTLCLFISCGGGSDPVNTAGTLDLKTVADATLPDAGGAAAADRYADAIYNDISTKAVDTLPDWFKLGDTSSDSDTATNAGWFGYEIFRFLGKSSRFNFADTTQSANNNWGADNILDDINLVSILIQNGMTPLNDVIKTVTYKNAVFNLSLTAASGSTTRNVGFLFGVGFTPQTYQYERTMTFDNSMVVKFAWSYADSKWKFLVYQTQTGTDERSHTVGTYDELSGALYLERISRTSNEKNHVRFRLDGNSKTKLFTLKYLRRYHNHASTASQYAFAIDAVGGADETSTTAHYLARIRFLTGAAYDSTIANATSYYFCSKAKSLDSDYASWYTAARTAAVVTTKYGNNLNEYSNYTALAGLQFFQHAFPIDDVTHLGTLTTCTAADVTAVNAITPYEDTDLPIEYHVGDVGYAVTPF